MTELVQNKSFFVKKAGISFGFVSFSASFSSGNIANTRWTYLEAELWLKAFFFVSSEGPAFVIFRTLRLRSFFGLA